MQTSRKTQNINFFSQKLRINHLTHADRSSKYFHAFMRTKNTNTFIPALVKSNGNVTTSQEDVIDELLTYYKRVLGTAPQVIPTSQQVFGASPILSHEDCVALSELVDDLMIKEALFRIGDDKAPGPDGYTAAFFKTNWELVKVEFLEAVHEFFNNGRLHKQINHAIIMLIPKTKHESTAANFRPISCCNVIYKTITRIIASRMATVLPHIINPTQHLLKEEVWWTTCF